MFWIILSILLLLVLIVLSYDFLDNAIDWFGRIKIGTIYDTGEWRNATRKVIVKWLSKGAPKVSKDERNRLKLINDIQNIGKINSISYWQDAALLKAANGMNDGYMQENVGELLNKYIDIFKGEWKTAPKRIDCAMLAYELLSSPYTDAKTIEPAMSFVAKMLREKAERCSTVPYNENVQNVRFVDTVGMICPFLIKYACVYGKPEYIDIAMKQIKEYNDFGLGKSGIPVHCFDVNSKQPLGIYGWGRGCAWWAVGLTDSLKSLLSYKGRNADKVYLLKCCVEFLNKMEKYQNDDGSFGRMIFIQSLQDSSAGAMLAYCYSYMFSLTKIDSYGETKEKMLEHLKTCTRRNGVIDYSQGDTRSIGFYSDSLSVIPAAQGFAVAADCIE